MATKKTNTKKSNRKNSKVKKSNKKIKAVDAKVYTMEVEPTVTPTVEVVEQPIDNNIDTEVSPPTPVIETTPTLDISEKIVEEEPTVSHPNNVVNTKESNGDGLLLVIGAIAVVVTLLLLAL